MRKQCTNSDSHALFLHYLNYSKFHIFADPYRNKVNSWWRYINGILYVKQFLNQLVECEICYDNECVPSKCSTCNEGHIFCNNCVIAGTNAKIGEGLTRIMCFVNCGSEISLSVLQRVLKPTTFSILLKKRQAAEVLEAGLEGLVSCPFCHFASIYPENDKIFKCLNSECAKESCRSVSLWSGKIDTR